MQQENLQAAVNKAHRKTVRRRPAMQTEQMSGRAELAEMPSRHGQSLERVSGAGNGKKKDKNSNPQLLQEGQKRAAYRAGKVPRFVALHALWAQRLAAAQAAVHRGLTKPKVQYTYTPQLCDCL